MENGALASARGRKAKKKRVDGNFIVYISGGVDRWYKSCRGGK